MTAILIGLPKKPSMNGGGCIPTHRHVRKRSLPFRKRSTTWRTANAGLRLKNSTATFANDTICRTSHESNASHRRACPQRCGQHIRLAVHRSVSGAISWYLAFGAAVDKIAASPETYAEASEAVPLGRPLRQSFFKTRRGRIYRIVFELSDAEIILLRIRGPGQSPLRQRELPGD